MLSCKYCDYYEEMRTKAEHGNEVSVCHFTDHMFMKDVESLDMEHPCSNMSYLEYLEAVQSISSKATA